MESLTADAASEGDTDEEENSSTDPDSQESSHFRYNEVLSSNSSSVIDWDDDRIILTRPSKYRGNRRLPRRYNDIAVQL